MKPVNAVCQIGSVCYQSIVDVGPDFVYGSRSFEWNVQTSETFVMVVGGEIEIGAQLFFEVVQCLHAGN